MESGMRFKAIAWVNPFRRTASRAMVDIYHYSDYRNYLKDAYLDLKKARPSGFTHRRIGQKGGFDPGLFSKVIQGQRNISEKLLPGFCRAFGLEGDEARYFHCLVRYTQADTVAERRLLEKELAAFPGRAGREARADQDSRMVPR
jgi:uncharacterized protein (TIGR02147 family)